MFTLTAIIKSVKPAFTSTKTGELIPPYVQYERVKRGEYVLEKFKIDASVERQWTAAVGKRVSCQVEPWALPGATLKDRCTIGVSLVDSKALPTVQADSPRAVPAAA